MEKGINDKLIEFYPREDVDFLDELSVKMDMLGVDHDEMFGNESKTEAYTAALINADDATREKLILVYLDNIQDDSLPDEERIAYSQSLAALQELVDAGVINRKPWLAKE